MRAVIAHSLVVLVGLLVLAYPLTVGAHPAVTCRGAVMQPGEVCVNSDGVGTQTFEQRTDAAADARPVVVVVGALVAAFGTVLLATELRRAKGAAARGGRPSAAG